MTQRTQLRIKANCFAGENGDHRLVGYVVTAAGKTPTVSELRRHLAKRLADYMIPSTFILMDVFPTTIGGKVDRNALSAPERGRPVLDQPYCPPNSALERQLVEIWGDLLGLDRVGIHDDFFELGGQSLLATQLVARIRGSFEVDVPIGDVLESSNIARLAELIETMRWLTDPTTVDPKGSESETF